MQSWSLQWPFGAASVRSSAAMLWDCELLLPSGRRFAPFARAPWADDPTVSKSFPAHLRHLGGEFACVPFGIGGEPQSLLPEWAGDSWREVNPVPHGLSADACWQHIRSDASEVCLTLDYPTDDDIERLTRRITVDPTSPALDFELTIHVRRRTRQPVGLHPILKLPPSPTVLRIEAAFEFGMTYPAFVPPGISRVAPGRRFSALDRIAGINGGTVDYSSLPKQTPTEEMLELCNVRGPVTVYYPDEHAYCRISWDSTVLPSCLLWPSDRSIGDAPWNGRFRGLGIEPIAAVFDAAREVCVRTNPLSEAGVRTCLDLEPAAPLTIRYRIEAGDA